MENQKNVLKQLEDFRSGKFDDPSVDVQIDAGWYDWFCKESSLKRRTKNLYSKLNKVLKRNEISQKFDPEKTYVFFKNNLPMVGIVYDDFRIVDIETGDVLYTIIPKSGMNKELNKSMVWGKENDFQEPLYKGDWFGLLEYFENK